MSHIVTNKEEMEQLLILQKCIKSDYLDKETLDLLLLHLSPKNENKSLLTDYKIYNSLPIGGAYIPKTKKIIFSLPSINSWIDLNTNDIKRQFNIHDYNRLREYVTIYPIIHEVEHAYQHMITLNEVDAPNTKVSYGYKYLFDFIANTNLNFKDKVKRIKNLPLYYRNKEDYVLEINANFETTTLLTELALYNGDKEIAEAFRNLTYSLIYKSYEKDNKGPMYHTFKELNMLDKYKNILNNKELDMVNNVRYGLEITKSERLSLLKK